jgi:putative flippase GtrA
VKDYGRTADEGLRYLVASAFALAVDFGLYVALIRLADVNYLVAAPLGFACGLATIYLFSVRWVFSYRRVADRRAEFALFAAIGLAGMALNQVIIYVAVQWMPGAYEIAKLMSAGMVFCFNFASRKLLLFTRK